VKNLSRKELKNLIKLEMKNLMDEDALFRGYDIPGDDDEHSDYSLQSMKSDCGCGSCASCDDDILSNEDPDYDDHKHHKSSSYMARPQLSKIAKYASHLLDMVDEGEELQDWQESKIAQMSQMMGDVYHSIEYDYSHDDLDTHNLIGMIRTGNI
jgi:hypothetical protein